MIEERRIDVKEARIGLAIIFCLLVALGAVVTHRMREASRSVTAQSTPQAPASILQITDNPQVAPPAKSDVQQATYEAQWLRPEEVATDNPVAPAVDYESGGSH